MNFAPRALAYSSGRSYSSFRDWCVNQAKLSGTTLNLIETLLLKVETSDCELAQRRLKALKRLNLDPTPLSDPNNVVTGPISDLRPLSTLTQLQSLNLYSQDITDLRPLSSLVNLTYLNLQATGVTNIEPLSALKKLRLLDLRHNPITDFKPLEDLHNLVTVYL